MDEINEMIEACKKERQVKVEELTTEMARLLVDPEKGFID